MGNTELPNASQQQTRPAEPSRWRENHGNFLLCMIGIILVAGSAVIAYRQTRARASRSPANVYRADADPSLRHDEMLLLADANTDGQGDRQTVTVRVIGAASDAGVIRLAVYTREQGFNDPNEALGVDSWRILGGVCEGQIGLPGDVDSLAIAAFHDQNNNGVLDQNAVGVAAERYGFTGGARSLAASPPEYSEAVVPITEEPIEISIR